MQATVRVFTITPWAPGAPAPAPQQVPDVTVEAKSHDGLRKAAQAALAAMGRLRSLSFTPKGGLLAYVEVKE
jgi:hypothetical protein